MKRRIHWSILIICTALLIWHFCAGLRSTAYMNEMSAESLGMLLEESNGQLQVIAIRQHSTADRGGIQPGDVLLTLNSVPITCEADVDHALDHYDPADSLHCTILRSGSEILVTLPTPRSIKKQEGPQP